jgi:hypothetical protein
VSALTLSVGVRGAVPMSGCVVTQLVTQYALDVLRSQEDVASSAWEPRTQACPVARRRRSKNEDQGVTDSPSQGLPHALTTVNWMPYSRARV